MKILFIAMLMLPSLCFAQIDSDSSTPSSAPTRKSRNNYQTDFHFLLEPVLGYEFLQRSYPNTHTEGMFFYGARAVAGSQMIAGELLYTHGSASESFATPTLLTADSTRDLIRIGPRTLIPLDHWIKLLVRLGEQASHDSFTYTSSTGSYQDSPKWEFHPYVGGGLIFHFIPELSLDFEGTYILNGDFEAGIGFRVYI